MKKIILIIVFTLLGSGLFAAIIDTPRKINFCPMCGEPLSDVNIAIGTQYTYVCFSCGYMCDLNEITSTNEFADNSSKESNQIDN